LSRRVVAVAIAAALAASADCLALGLGKPLGEPVLGETLRLELPLTGTLDRPVDADCVQVRRSGDISEDDYFPRDISARIDRQGGASRVILATRSALRQPLLEFRLVITCGYNLVSDFVLAVSPPRPTTDTARPAGAVRMAGAEPVAAPAAAKALPDGLAGVAYTVDQPMTLQQLARKHFPGPLRQERFMRWVAEANPEVFAKGRADAQFKLPVGTALTLPSGVPPRRPGDHATAAAEAAPEPTRATAAADSARPATAAPSPRADRLVVGAGGSRRDLRETMALVDRLTAMAEQQMAAQTAATEKIQALETALAELQKSMTQMDAAARERQNKLELETRAVRQELEDQANQAWWQMLLAVAAGGLVGAGIAFWLRRRPSPHAALAAEVQALEPQLVPPGPAESIAAEQAIIDSFDEGTLTANTDAPAGASGAAAVAVAGVAPPKAGGGIDIVLEPPVSQASPADTLSGGLQVAAGDPAAAAIELANIMTSMGLAESAAQTLVEHIRENPRQSLHHWLKLLDLHRLNGNRDEFERSTEEMRQYFNVRADDWDRTPSAAPRSSLENYTHIRAKLVEVWRQPECVEFLQSLMMDNREGTRTGFPLPVAEEILLLIAIQSND
jgi:hypothetical protein